MRPGKGTRPRSKRRPEHADARAAMVVGVDRGRWTCALDAEPDRQVIAMRARELGRTPIVVGDRSASSATRPAAGHARPDRAGRRPHARVLRRTADDNDPFERVVVANAEQLLIVMLARRSRRRARVSSTAASSRRTRAG